MKKTVQMLLKGITISCLVAGVSLMIVGCACPFKKCDGQKKSCCPCPSKNVSEAPTVSEGQSCEK